MGKGPPVRRTTMYRFLGVGSPIGQLILLKKRVFIRIQELYYGLFNHLEPPPPNSDEGSSTAILVRSLEVSDEEYVMRLMVWVVDIIIEIDGVGC